jgi:hypothetical protein
MTAARSTLRQETVASGEVIQTASRRSSSMIPPSIAHRIDAGPRLRISSSLHAARRSASSPATIDKRAVQCRGSKITLRSLTDPAGSAPVTLAPPSKQNGSKGRSAMLCGASPVSCIPDPSMTAISRSYPAKDEKGPALSTRATLTRQRNSSADCGGAARRATSKVTPPPLRHGCGERSAARSTRGGSTTRGSSF